MRPLDRASPDSSGVPELSDPFDAQGTQRRSLKSPQALANRTLLALDAFG